MTIHRVKGYDGKDRGWQGNAYVYMLLCQDDGPVYVKVGRTSAPTHRLYQLRNGCPVTPHQFHFIELRTKHIAARVELELHSAFARWRAHGEWYSVPLTERGDFNAAWRPVIERLGDPQFPSRWQRASVAAVIRDAQSRVRAKNFLYGKAGRDARAAGLPAGRQ